jgi:hypothetical protein
MAAPAGHLLKESEMGSHGSRLSLATLLVVVGSAAVARADEAEPPDPGPSKPVQAFPWFVGVGAGAGLAMISHPQIISGDILAPTFTLNGGYTFGDHLSLGLELTSMETSVGRDAPGDLFQLGHAPQAKCLTCYEEVRPGGVVATSLVSSTLGARVEYAPFSRDGLFVGATAGLAFMVGLETKSGFGFGGRVGYRLRPTSIFTVSIEAGMTGQLYDDATIYMPFGVLVVRPYFEGPSQARRSP